MLKVNCLSDTKLHDKEIRSGVFELPAIDTRNPSPWGLLILGILGPRG